MKEKENRWVSEKIISRIYGISIRTLQKARQRAPYTGFPYRRFGRSIRYNIDECAEYANRAGVENA